MFHAEEGDDDAESAVVIADAGGTVRYLSPNFESLYRCSRYEILGAGIRSLGRGRRDAAFFRAIGKALRSGRPWSGILSTADAEGRPRVEAATICPVADASGVVRECVAVRRDVTGTGLREEAARRSRAMEAVARLAGGMAHHFNNILTSILGHSDLLLDRMAGDAEATRSANEIRQAGERAAALTRQLLAFSGEQALVPQLLDVNALVAHLGGGLRARWGGGIEIRIDLAEEAGTVAADPDQIAQAILALAANARDAMPGGGRLTFTTGNVRFAAPAVRDRVHVLPGNYVTLAVSDTGAGIAPDVRERIFEPFLSTKASSPGLGLAAVYGIVKQSGGYIWAISSPGHGATFEIYLPRVRRARAEGDAERGRPAPPAGANRLPGERRHTRRSEARDASTVMAASPEGR